jgi:uncharacterized membrane protein (UPF0127 family)
MKGQGRIGFRAVHLGSGRVLASRLQVPRTPLGRALGLMFRAPLRAGEGMWIAPCRGIHTCFLSGRIDAVFLDREHRVLRVRERLAPWRAVPLVRGAHGVLELPAGTVAGVGLRPGDRLLIGAVAAPQAAGEEPPAVPEQGSSIP